MSDNQDDAYDNLKNRLNELEFMRAQAQRDVRRAETQIEELGERISQLQQGADTARFLLDCLVKKRVGPLESLVTEGLRSVFADQSLSFNATPVRTRNRIGVELTLSDGGVTGDPMKSFGGAPASIISLLLRLVTIQKNRLYPVLFLDESLPAISGEYVKNTLMLLQKLAELRGIEIFLITHNPTFLDYATVAYQAQKVGVGDGQLQVRRLL